MPSPDLNDDGPNTTPLTGTTDTRISTLEIFVDQAEDDLYPNGTFDPLAIYEPIQFSAAIAPYLSPITDSITALEELVAGLEAGDLTTLQTNVTVLQVDEIDLESDLGCVFDDSSNSIAVANLTKLNAALAAMNPYGTVTLLNGSIVHVLVGLTMPAKELFIRGGPAKTHIRVGGRLRCKGGTKGYLLGINDYGNDVATIGGAVGRITRTDGEATNSIVFLMRGSEFTVENIMFSGQKMTAFGTPQGTRSGVCIGIEGRDPPSTGKHTFINCGFALSTVGVKAYAGYFSEDMSTFTADESHADECLFINCNSTYCPTAIQSLNQQAVGWQLLKFAVNIGGGSVAAAETVTVFDFVRGGNLTVNGLLLNHPRVKVLQVTDFSPNNNSFDIHGIRYDTPTAVDPSLVLFYYAGPAGQTFETWRVRMSGHFADQPPTLYTATNLVNLGHARLGAGGIDASDLFFDIKWLDATAAQDGGAYSWSSSGPWKYLHL